MPVPPTECYDPRPRMNDSGPRSEYLDRLASDRSLLVGRDRPDGNAARLRGNSLCSALIGSRIKHQAEPGASLADTPADLGCVLTDAGRENQAIKPAKRRDQGAQLTGDAIHEQIDRLLGARVVARRAIRACRC